MIKACPFRVMIPISVGTCEGNDYFRIDDSTGLLVQKLTSIPSNATMPEGSKELKRVWVIELFDKKSASLGMYLSIEFKESRPTRKERGMTQKIVAADQNQVSRDVRDFRRRRTKYAPQINTWRTKPRIMSLDRLTSTSRFQSRSRTSGANSTLFSRTRRCTI